MEILVALILLYGAVRLVKFSFAYPDAYLAPHFVVLAMIFVIGSFGFMLMRTLF